jgi:hypothetical protein
MAPRPFRLHREQQPPGGYGGHGGKRRGAGRKPGPQSVRPFVPQAALQSPQRELADATPLWISRRRWK